MTGYRNPVPTVDVIIEIRAPGVASAVAPGGSDGDAEPGVVLIRRKNAPHGWALPGGFVDYGESLARAAVREAAEETELQVELVEQFFSYSNPDRDPRQHTMSTVFIGRAEGRPRAADDATRAEVFTRATLPADIVFDHRQILDDYFAYRATGARPPADR